MTLNCPNWTPAPHTRSEVRFSPRRQAHCCVPCKADLKTDDGRVDIDLSSRIVKAVSLLLPAPAHEPKPSHRPATDSKPPVPDFPVNLNIVIQVVGSRGDVQPFLALGNELHLQGHRVRVATHDVFADFVQKAGLEFYPVGGDPAALMAYMVKNPSLMPSLQTIMEGEIGRKRTMVANMLDGFWDSCLQPDPVTDLPFVADAIIANPPSFAHVHCAQALGIPVHMMFTMPWSPTRAFPHPLANLSNAGDDHGWANFMSYHLVEWMTW